MIEDTVVAAEDHASDQSHELFVPYRDLAFRVGVRVQGKESIEIFVACAQDLLIQLGPVDPCFRRFASHVKVSEGPDRYRDPCFPRLPSTCRPLVSSVVRIASRLCPWPA